ncbi:MAG: hypothetical protein KDK39_04040 [Leptospiraceae bacterium]|nr:hypothetical protein [Leptospiraceae bacterium]
MKSNSRLSSRLLNRKIYALSLVAFLISFVSSPLWALGSYAEGWRVVKLLRMEESGLIFSSYEGKFEVMSFDSGEKCVERDYMCYTPTTTELRFSVRSENTDVVNFLKDNEGQEFVIRYRQHLIEPVALSTDLEVLEIKALTEDKPAELPATISVEKAGSKRSFAIQGRVIKLDYEGNLVGTFEGLYLDTERNKVFPFSVTEEALAKHVMQLMVCKKSYFMGLSQAYVNVTFRESDYDLFAIDMDKAPR